MPAHVPQQMAPGGTITGSNLPLNPRQPNNQSQLSSNAYDDDEEEEPEPIR